MCGYLHYKQFLHGLARVWHEVPWVAKISFLSAEQGKKRFGSKAWVNIPLDSRRDGKNAQQDDDPDKGGEARPVSMKSGTRRNARSCSL